MDGSEGRVRSRDPIVLVQQAALMRGSLAAFGAAALRAKLGFDVLVLSPFHANGLWRACLYFRLE